MPGAKLGRGLRAVKQLEPGRKAIGRGSQPPVGGALDAAGAQYYTTLTAGEILGRQLLC